MEAKAEEKIRELLEFAKEHGLAEVTYQENGMKVSFRRNLKPRSGLVQSAGASDSFIGEPESAGPVDEIVRSPIVGTFRRSLSKDHPPLILEGNHIKPGDRLGVVECMKIPTEVVSFLDGVIKRIMVEDGQVVEYGQPLIAVTPAQSSILNTDGKK